MFISVTYLQETMGVNERIARFFVDRRVPENNAFWKGKLLYIGRGNGFMNIPVYYDILARIGVPVQQLLDEDHIQFMERIMHFAIQAERGQISFKEQLERITGLLQERIQNYGFYEELTDYLYQDILKPTKRLGIVPPALNRADTFLFILCDLSLTETQLSSAIHYWYALHPTYLLMDDIYDYKKDKQNNEENAVVELGDGIEGFEKAFGIIEQNIATLQNINSRLANTMQAQLEPLRSLVV